MTVNASAGRTHAAGDRANPSPVMLDVDGFADLLKVSTRHIRRLVDAGKCPQPVRLGRVCRWPRPVVESWIANGCPKIRTVRAGGAK
jgi:predicted DNA-binding transcriptional regulator AlpA